jgi:hypothetical protein
VRILHAWLCDVRVCISRDYSGVGVEKVREI